MLGLTGGFAVALLSALTAFAQQNAPPAPTPVVEVYGCKFNANKGMNELHSVTARWNAWADKNKINDYTAFIVTPFLVSADVQNDVLWLGAWPNATAMAADSALGATKEGRDIDAAFDAVEKCASHSLYTELVIHEPKDPPPENGAAAFRDCTVHGFVRVDELLGRILDCNSPRVYTIERVRLAARPPAASGAR